MKPVTRNSAPPGCATEAYNVFQSSTKIHLEQVLGHLISRWWLLSARLHYTIELNVRMITTAMSMHNYCIDMQDFTIHDFVSAQEEDEELALLRSLTSWGGRVHSRSSDSNSVYDVIILDVVGQGLCPLYWEIDFSAYHRVNERSPHQKMLGY